MASSAAQIQAAIVMGAHERKVYGELKEANHKLLENAIGYAKDIAPVGGTVSDDQHPGQFRDSIVGKELPDRKGLPASQMRSDDDGAASIEFGTSRTPEHGTFAKTAIAFGGDGINNPHVTGQRRRRKSSKTS
jgi:hypothetical protein